MSGPRRLALALFAAYLATAIPVGLVKAARRLGRAAIHIGESPRDARRRVYGKAYSEAVEAIRRAIPRDAAYGLVDGDPDPLLGTPFWLRFDLAPRRAVELNRGLSPPSGLRWVVATHGSDPPVLLTADRYVSTLEHRP